MAPSQSYDYGVSIRTSRIFNEKTGRSVVIALDHGIALGAVSGLERLGDRLQQVVNGQPEGVLLNTGGIRRFGNLLVGRLKPAAILALDFPLFASHPGGEITDGSIPTISASEAVRLGADMAKLVMVFGQSDTRTMMHNFTHIAKTIEECHRVGLPVMVEPTTWGLRFKGEDPKDPKTLADMARIAYEIGADVVKSDFPANPKDMALIAEACPVPIVLLGGGKTDSIDSMLEDVLGCIQQGANGIAFGRNVWQHPDPAKLIRAIQCVVHAEDLKAAREALR
jgi:fructose-bisphosphate aldolase, class I